MSREDELRFLAKKIPQILKEKYKIKRFFLIGSLVSGIVHERFDIDLVVEGLSSELYIKALTEVYDILRSGLELNLIPFEDAFTSLKEKTLKKVN
ncbi:MAG: nucleotidyltransferase domain-containing protein [Candidatus Omnitrophica bacterium]|nr:nucleotidyltransferase domain-containing protein [Candidatus Omnitrophota bacterium]